MNKNDLDSAFDSFNQSLKTLLMETIKQATKDALHEGYNQGFAEGQAKTSATKAKPAILESLETGTIGNPRMTVKEVKRKKRILPNKEPIARNSNKVPFLCPTMYQV